MKKESLSGAFSRLLTLLGGAGVAAALIMSETLYPEIDELSACPLPYKLFLALSLGASLLGAILSAAFRRSGDGARIARLKKERTIELITLIAGFALMVGGALCRTENRVLDLMICVGGALCALGLFSLLGTALALAFSKPRGLYADLIREAARGGARAALCAPAPLGELLAFESALGAMLPRELIAFYEETNGDGDLMFSIEEAWETTVLLRRSDADAAKLVCIGGDGAGNYFCYREAGGDFEDGIFRYDHEERSSIQVAKTPAELMVNYYADRL